MGDGGGGPPYHLLIGMLIGELSPENLRPKWRYTAEVVPGQEPPGAELGNGVRRDLLILKVKHQLTSDVVLRNNGLSSSLFTTLESLEQPPNFPHWLNFCAPEIGRYGPTDFRADQGSVTMIGFMGDHEGHLFVKNTTPSSVVNYSPESRSGQLVLEDSLVDQGFSGNPILLDGKLAAVVTGYLPDRKNAAIATIVRSLSDRERSLVGQHDEDSPLLSPSSSFSSSLSSSSSSSSSSSLSSSFFFAPPSMKEVDSSFTNITYVSLGSGARLPVAASPTESLRTEASQNFEVGSVTHNHCCNHCCSIMFESVGSNEPRRRRHWRRHWCVAAGERLKKMVSTVAAWCVAAGERLKKMVSIVAVVTLAVLIIVLVQNSFGTVENSAVFEESRSMEVASPSSLLPSTRKPSQLRTGQPSPLPTTPLPTHEPTASPRKVKLTCEPDCDDGTLSMRFVDDQERDYHHSGGAKCHCIRWKGKMGKMSAVIKKDSVIKYAAPVYVEDGDTDAVSVATWKDERLTRLFDKVKKENACSGSHACSCSCRFMAD